MDPITGSHTLAVGSWVQAVVATSAVQTKVPIGRSLTVIAWDQTAGNGTNLACRVAAFAKVTVLGNDAPAGQLTVRFDGWADAPAAN
jgi:hypothetical protein